MKPTMPGYRMTERDREVYRKGYREGRLNGAFLCAVWIGLSILLFHGISLL